MVNSAGFSKETTQKFRDTQTTAVTNDLNRRKKGVATSVTKPPTPPKHRFVPPAWARHAVPNKRPTKKRLKKPSTNFATDAELEVEPSTGITSYVYELESANKEPFVINNPIKYVFESS